jgi:hypothetical protein
VIDAVKLWEQVNERSGGRLPLGTCGLVHGIAAAINEELRDLQQPIVTMKPIPPENAAKIQKALADFERVYQAERIVLREVTDDRELCKRLDEAIHAREHYKELMEWLVTQRRALCQTIGDLRHEREIESTQIKLLKADGIESRKCRDEWTRMYDELLEAVAAPGPEATEYGKHAAALRHCKAQRERLASIENRLSHARDCLSNAEGYISSSANLAAGGVE